MLVNAFGSQARNTFPTERSLTKEKRHVGEQAQVSTAALVHINVKNLVHPLAAMFFICSY